MQSSSNPDPVTLHDAWINAARANGEPGAYGIFELASAIDDQLSATPQGLSVPVTPNGIWSTSNPVVFYDASVAASFPTTQTSLSTTSPGSYQLVPLIKEGWTDSYLSTQADQYELGSTKFYVSSNLYKNVSASYIGRHYEASGAVITDANMSTLPYNFAQTDAYNYAVSELNQHGGVPSDAVLHEVVTHYRHDPSGTVILGYEFIWVHANGDLGGDRIDVGVDNSSHKECTQWEYTGNCSQKTCVAWQTVFDQRIDYMYRLWRSLGTPAPVGSPPPPAISASKAYAFSLAQSKLKGTVSSLGSFVGYTYAYWTPPYDSLDTSAHPAYNYFYSSGTVVTVDALSGKVLGASGDY